MLFSLYKIIRLMKPGVYKKMKKALSPWLLVFILCTSKFINTKAQTCTSTAFTTYYNYNWRGQGGFFQKINSGGYLFGFMKDERKRVVTRVDANTNILWSKLYDYVGSTNLLNTFPYSNGVEDNDGNYFIDIQREAFALLDPLGNMLTTKHLRNPAFAHVTSIHSLLVLPDNRKLVFLQDHSNVEYYSYAIVCLSADLSTILWTKHLKQYEFYGHALSYSQGKLYLLGSSLQTFDRQGIIIALDANTGSLLNQVKFISNEVGGAVTLRNIYRYNDGFIITGFTPIQGLNKHFFLRTDNDFNITRSYYFSMSTMIASHFQPFDVPLIVESSGDFYGAITNSFGHHRFYMSASDSIIWNRYNFLSAYGSLFGFTKSNDGLVLFCRSETPDILNGVMIHAASISKSTYTGLFPGCVAGSLELGKSPLQLTKGISDIDVRDTSLFTLENLTGLAEANDFPVHNRCSGLSTCSDVAVQGPGSVCTSASVTFSALRNPQCFTSISWQLLGGNANMTTVNDSSVSIQFLQQGNYKLIAKLDVSCSVIADTLDVNVLAVLPALNIGPPDSALCSNSPGLLLDAVSGFVSYLWQDGSTGQTFNVTAPGLFHVTVKDQCDQVFKDSILIYPVITPALNIGNDNTVCVNDTFRINASPGFQTYSWQPVIEIHGLGQNIYVIPKTDLRVSVIARTAEGCIAKDTIDLTALYTTKVNLGNDLDLCKGDTSLIVADSGFGSYEWNTGSASQQIQVFDKGLYWVKALNMNGCYSRDTIEVRNLFELPIPNLGSDFKLCQLENKVIDPGVFSSYLWNDNSRSRYLTIKNAGMYWVSVIDVNNCKGIDTVYVIKKDCVQTVYIPNSFTPNADSKNDVFKATVFADSPKKFELYVYNRYGQIVFYSTDITKGWDGTFNGKLQPVSGYTWHCIYQFDGKMLNNETGTVLLIR